MQTQLKLSGTLSSSRCTKQSKAYSERHGQSFFLECSLCATRTPKFPTLQEAVQAWETADTGSIQKAVA